MKNIDLFRTTALAGTLLAATTLATLKASQTDETAVPSPTVTNSSESSPKSSGWFFGWGAKATPSIESVKEDLPKEKESSPNTIVSSSSSEVKKEAVTSPVEVLEEKKAENVAQDTRWFWQRWWGSSPVTTASPSETIVSSSSDTGGKGDTVVSDSVPTPVMTETQDEILQGVLAQLEQKGIGKEALLKFLGANKEASDFLSKSLCLPSSGDLGVEQNSANTIADTLNQLHTTANQTQGGDSDDEDTLDLQPLFGDIDQ